MPADISPGHRMTSDTVAKNMIYRITRITARLVLGMRYLIDIRGREHLPRDNAFVLLPKHQCWQDVPLVGLATPIFLTYVAKHEQVRHLAARSSRSIAVGKWCRHCPMPP